MSPEVSLGFCPWAEEDPPTWGCTVMDGVGNTWNFSSDCFYFLKGGREASSSAESDDGEEVRSSQDRGESLKQLRMGECLKRRTRACQAVISMFGCFSQAMVNVRVQQQSR